MKALEVRFGVLPSLHANDEKKNGYCMDFHGYMAASITENGCLCFGGFLHVFSWFAM